MSMTRSKGEGKRSLGEIVSEAEEDEEAEDEDNFEEGEEVLEKKQKGKVTSSSGVCQVESCNADMSKAKQYHKRHKVCEFHAKASFVRISDLHQRFCQQCSRFHEVSEFDDTKRSCRRRLAGHNERRRKSTTE